MLYYVNLCYIEFKIHDIISTIMITKLNLHIKSQQRWKKHTAIYRFLIVFILVCFLIVSHFEVSIADDPKILVGVLENWPPQYTVNTKTKQPDGFAVEIMNEISRKTNHQIEYKTYRTWTNLIKSLKNREIDVIPNVGITTEREQFFNFTVPVETAILLFFKRKASTEIKNVDNLKDRSVSVVETNKGRYLLEEKNWKNITIYKSLEEALMSLLSGNTDALVYSDPPLTTVLEKHGLDDRIESFGSPLLEIKRGICTHKDDKALSKSLNKAVLSLLDSNKYKEIYSKWHGKKKSFWTTRLIVLSMSVLLLIVVVSMVVWHFISLAMINKTLKKAEKRYRSLFENMNAGFVLFESVQNGHGIPVDLIIIDANEGFEHTTGLEIKNIRGKRLTKVLPGIENDEADWVGTYGMVALTGKPRQFEQGSELLGYYYSINAYQAGPKKCAVTFTDITDRKKAEIERERLLMAIEQTEDIVIITAPDGKIQYVNPAFETVTGYNREEALSQNLRMLKSDKQDKAIYSDLWETITNGQSWKGRIVNKRKDGSLFTDESMISPVKDDDGNILNFVAVKRDITEQIRVNEEKASLEAQLVQAQKMESIGSLAGGIAHDFNNILSSILGFSELVKEDLSDDDTEINDNISEVIIAAHRAKELVQHILTFSRHSDVDKKMLLIAPLIKETIKLLKATLPASIEIRTFIESADVTVIGDSAQFHQIIMNLCTNASYAMEKNGGILTIVLEKITLAKTDIIEYPDLEQGIFYKLTISDTGQGISKKNINQIFDPFFTTKERGEGTGMGLSVVHGVVKEMNGIVTVKSKPGKGTSFHILLPAQKNRRTHDIFTEEKTIERNEGRILFVDDDNSILRMADKKLKKAGYTMTVMNNSFEALELFKSSPKAFDVIITDLDMPNMDGIELANQILLENESIPIILCTGFSKGLTKEFLSEAGIHSILMKPVIMSELIKTINSVLRTNQ